MPAEAQLSLTVIVPCYNVADTLAEQLDALADERWSGNWEVLIVDNGSTDATVAVAKASRLGARLRVVTALDGQSVAYARNAGVGASTARSVAFCDGDDIIRPGWVAAMGDALETQSLVTGATVATRINEGWLAQSRPGGDQVKLSKFGVHPFASGGNCGMWRILWEHLGGYDEDFKGLEDIEFSLRATALGVVPTLVADAVIDYRYRTGLHALWRQGFFFGHGRRELSRRARALGLRSPSPVAGLKSWIWLLVHLPTIRSRAHVYAWLWVLANRVGSLAGFFARSQPFAFDAQAASTWQELSSAQTRVP